MKNPLWSRSGFIHNTAILRLFREGVICVDQDGEIFFSNKTARELLHLKTQEGKFENFEQYHDALMINGVIRDGAPRVENMIALHGEDLVVTTLPVTIHARQQGAVAFISDVAAIHNITGRLRGMQRSSGFTAHFTINDIKGEDPGIARVRKMVKLYAQHNAALCIQGETGTDKELLAQSLHNAGSRRAHPFGAINCAALPESLLESELFGYAEGAFTGARRGGKPGVFEMAHRGTLFLDEIGDIGHSAQLRLLRALETKEIIRVGGNGIIPVDIRVISASHKALADLVSTGAFRRDLFYRLAVLRLHIPPLRLHPQDIPMLLSDLLRRYGRNADTVTSGMHEAMASYAWPGNVRELFAFFESYLILLEGRQKNEKLFLELLRDWTEEGKSSAAQGRAEHQQTSGDLKTQLRRARQEIVRETVQNCAWNKSLAASLLGISYNTLWRILGENNGRRQAP